MRFVPSLTGVRGAAALWVVLHHVDAVYLKPRGFPPIPLAPHGWVGVDLFFLLSGFILMATHEPDFQRLRTDAIARFAFLRVVRVYPVATAALLLVLLLVLVDPGFAAFYATRAPGNLSTGAFFKTLLLATRWFPPFEGDWNQPVWSLSVEILGYAAFPWLAHAIGRLPRVWPALVVAGTSLGGLVAAEAMTGRLDVNAMEGFGVVRMAGGFVAGIALCRAAGTMREQGSRIGGIADVAVVLLVVSCLAPSLSALRIPACAGLVFGLYGQAGLLNGVLSTRPAVFLGRISFPLYLVHVMPLLWLAHRTAGIAPDLSHVLPTLVLYGLVCLGLAVLLHRAVETPSHKAARRLIDGWRARAHPRPAMAGPGLFNGRP